MRERFERGLKAVCVILAVMLLARLIGLVGPGNPLRDVVVPTAPAASRGEKEKAGDAGRPGAPRRVQPALPPAIQARVNHIQESHVFGAPPAPLPMALMGIAGDRAILRGPHGQEGLVREGDTHDGLKVLKIGVNRILIEQDGQEKELTLHQGFGGPSLMNH